MRLALALGAALLCACGGVPAEPTEPAPAPPLGRFGWLDLPAAEGAVWPRDVAALAELDARWSGPLLDPAPPLAEALRRARQHWGDLASEPPVPGPPGRTFWGRWGLAADRPVRFVVAGVEGSTTGRVLSEVLRALQAEGVPEAARQRAVDAALSQAPAGDLHTRLLATVEAPERLVEALRFHLQRRGWALFEVGEPPPGFARELALPADTILVARAPTEGDLLLLRGREAARALDWVRAASPSAPAAALLALALRPGASPPPLSRASRLQLSFGGLANGEAAVASAGVLRGLSGTSPDLEVLLASAELTAACTDRWRRLGHLAFSTDFTWQAGDDPRLAVHLTPHGRAAAAGAMAPALVDPARWAALPLAAYGRWHRPTFLTLAPELADLPETPQTLYLEMASCAAGHPLAAAAATLAGLPAADLLAWIPAPLPGELPLLGRQPRFLGATVLGFADGAAEIGLVSAALPGDFPREAEPLGPEARLEVTPEGPRFFAGEGALTLGYARRPAPEGLEAALLAFGGGALARLGSHLAAVPAADAPALLAVARAEGLRPAAGAASDPEARAVIEAWAALGLSVEVRGTLDPGGLTYVVSPRAVLDPARGRP